METRGSTDGSGLSADEAGRLLVVVGGTAETAWFTCDRLMALGGGRFSDCAQMKTGSSKADVKTRIGNRKLESVVVAVCDQGTGAEALCGDLRQVGWTVKIFKTLDQLRRIVTSATQ